MNNTCFNELRLEGKPGETEEDLMEQFIDWKRRPLDPADPSTKPKHISYVLIFAGQVIAGPAFILVAYYYILQP